ncbi:nucleotidyl transferase AbiEii/AbiGii toxin family protein [Candidatus Omnitrophota bacterium]
MYNQLQLREIFHLEFLRWFSRKAKSKHYAIKGGTNLRFFFKSFRYSEDMDLDACGIRKDALLDMVMQILESKSFQDALRSFGLERIVPPNIVKAKQTETTQRFKVHLITYAQEDLFTKIEFSRRGLKGEIVVEPVLDEIARAYKVPPLLIPHYSISSAIEQKVEALSARAVTQARDIFDLYTLSSQYKPTKESPARIPSSKLKKICERVFDINFDMFRDAVVAYLSIEDQNTYSNSDVWDEVKLKVVHFLEELSEKSG